MTPLILSALLLLANAFASSQANGSATPPNAFATYQANEGAGLQRSEAPQSKGTANYATIGGPRYLAIRAKRGTLVRITGPGGEWVTRSTDYGPAKGTGDIADIALGEFARLCGWTVEFAREMGECEVTIERLGDIALPETDTE